MKCCCGHDEALHLGGVDIGQAALQALHAQRPGGDGGMCRAEVNGARCECFNFCTCHIEVPFENGEVA